MEVIAQLEPSRRGAYTGAFGYVSRHGHLELAMAIRTMQFAGTPCEEGDYFAGGGIVADSDPARELEETRWKAAQLTRLAVRAPQTGHRTRVAPPIGRSEPLDRR
jgi:anthranilate/para-aminobenzoate synthase component I